MVRMLIAVMLFSVAFATQSQPVWKLLGYQADRTISIDLTTIADEGGYKRASTLHNYTEAQPGDNPGREALHKSTIAVSYFDCKNRKSAVVGWLNYAEPFGQGKTMSTHEAAFDPHTLKNVIPGSLGEGLLDFVCATTGQRI